MTAAISSSLTTSSPGLAVPTIGTGAPPSSSGRLTASDFDDALRGTTLDGRVVNSVVAAEWDSLTATYLIEYTCVAGVGLRICKLTALAANRLVAEHRAKMFGATVPHTSITRDVIMNHQHEELVKRVILLEQQLADTLEIVKELMYKL